jgi:hypothetical protein
MKLNPKLYLEIIMAKLVSFQEYMKQHPQTRGSQFIEVGSLGVSIEEINVSVLLSLLKTHQKTNEGKELILRCWSNDDHYAATGEIHNDIGYYQQEPIEEYTKRCKEMYNRYVEFFNYVADEDKRDIDKEIKELEERLAMLKGDHDYSC